MATAHQGPILHQTYVECDGCEDDNEVEWYCISCKSNLCGSCKTARLHRKHILKPWKDPEAVSARQDAPIPCKVHPDKTYVNYCTDCDVLCCSTCNAGDHNGHHFKTIEDIIGEKRTALMNFIDELKGNCTSKAKEKREKLAGIKEKSILRCSMNKKKIKQKINSLRQNLTLMEVNLMREEDIIKNDKVSTLEKEILEVEEKEDKITETIEDIEKELLFSSNQSIIQKSLSSLSLEGYKVQDTDRLPTNEFEVSDFQFPSATDTIGSRKKRTHPRTSVIGNTFSTRRRTSVIGNPRPLSTSVRHVNRRSDRGRFSRVEDSEDESSEVEDSDDESSERKELGRRRVEDDIRIQPRNRRSEKK